MILTVTIRSDDGQAIGALVLAEKTFASGKQGYFGQGKLVINGERYQCQAQMVRIEKTGEQTTGAV